MSKKVYAVAVHVEAVAMVLAGNEVEAIDTAERKAREIVRESPDPLAISVIGRVTSQSQLAQHGWDEMCIPYGGDGNTRLSEILPATEAA